MESAKIYNLLLQNKSMAKSEKSAGAVIYYFDSEKHEPIFLLLQNTLKSTYLEFPKGHIEENESLEETVKREVKEETHLSTFTIIPKFQKILSWFFKFNGELIKKDATYLLIRIPKEEKENVKISNEHQSFFWLNFDETQKKLKIKANRELAKEAFDFIVQEEKQKRLF